MLGYDEPCFVISVAARILGVQTQTLRYYERLGLLEPQRTSGNQRVYSRREVERVRRIRELMDDLGVNLAGVEVVMKLLDRLQETEAEAARLAEENARLTAIVSGVIR
ncbi:MAG: MerR family transcriptional regulator [SAR202 cluster bacterium]|nr:MerR family transcriptional regulator [SAR202 cluster bacterium]